MTLAEFRYRPDEIIIVWDSGHESRYHSLWLYDNNPRHRDSKNRQRLIDVADLPSDVKITRAVVARTAIQVYWTDGCAACFPVSWLGENCPCGNHLPTE
jgi:hypothetical protein